jgi:hypothetical protein
MYPEVGSRKFLRNVVTMYTEPRDVKSQKLQTEYSTDGFSYTLQAYRVFDLSAVWVPVECPHSGSVFTVLAVM